MSSFETETERRKRQSGSWRDYDKDNASIVPGVPNQIKIPQQQKQPDDIPTRPAKIKPLLRDTGRGHTAITPGITSYSYVAHRKRDSEEFDRDNIKSASLSSLPPELEPRITTSKYSTNY